MRHINIHINCPASPVESFGQIGIELANHFRQWGEDVTLIDSIDPQKTGGGSGGIYMGHPDQWHRFATPPGNRLAIAMNETTKIPVAWVPILNDVDAIVTPCRWCVDMFRDNGITAPIHVAPLGIDAAYQYVERTSDGPYTFMACIDRGKRKGGDMALRAFRRAFGDSMDYRLILKTRAVNRLVSFADPNVELVRDDLAPAQMAALYGRVDVYLSPSYGEGFGMMPREAAAVGCVSLATAWSGTADDIGVWGIPLPYTLVDAGNGQGEWAQPNFDVLVDMMVTIAKHRDVYRDLARDAAVRVRGLYRWDSFAAKVLGVWNDI